MLEARGIPSAFPEPGLIRGRPGSPSHILLDVGFRAPYPPLKEQFRSASRKEVDPARTA